ncbi:MAG: hypothetical protein Q9160_001502 [Pyrenula sp. 1 TL-2023]
MGKLNNDSKLSFTSYDLLRSKDALPVVKFAIILGLAVALCVVSLQNPKDILRSKRQFRSWYSQYVYQFNIIAQDNCTDAYSIYLYGTRQNTSNPTLSGAGQFTLFVQPMIDCLLENASDYIQYQLSSSQVILGLTPTIIALLGTSSEEVCLLALIGRRRLLGFLLSVASPSIYTERAFKYLDPDKILKDLDDNHVRATVFTKPRWFFVFLEYIAVLSAITNIATLNWQLGVKSVNAMNPNTIFMPMLWSLLGIVAHLLGAIVFNMRARGLDGENKTIPRSTLVSCLEALKKQIRRPWSVICNILAACRDVARREVSWLPNESGEKLYFTYDLETRCFTFLAWLLSVLIIFHIILGTLILSSTNFVGPKDALGIMARYVLSVIICRVILVYELSVLGMEYKDLRDLRWKESP